MPEITVLESWGKNLRSETLYPKLKPPKYTHLILNVALLFYILYSILIGSEEYIMYNFSVLYHFSKLLTKYV